VFFVFRLAKTECLGNDLKLGSSDVKLYYYGPFSETAAWARVRLVVLARVSASCAGVPAAVWRNGIFQHGWLFPSKNRPAALPIGKRRQLYLTARLLKANMTQLFKTGLPLKLVKTSAWSCDL